MEKRLILAVTISVLVIVGFQFFVGKPSLPPPTTAIQSPAVLKEAAPESVSGPKPSFEETEFVVETARHIITFSNVGGSIKEIRLKEHKDVNTGEAMKLAAISDPRNYIFALSDTASSPALDLSEYAIIKKGGRVIYTRVTKDLEIRKEYDLSNTMYGIELQLFVKNLSSSPLPFNYSLVSGAGVTAASPQDQQFIEAASKINGKMSANKRPKEGKTITPGTVEWTAMKNKYFSLVMKPFVMTRSEFISGSKDDGVIIGINPELSPIHAGSTIENKFVLFAGPGNIPTLQAFGYGLEETVNYGFFGGISKALIAVMAFLYKVVRSWGLAIILLSVFLNVILFPLSMKSFKSMQKMQELHPQMEKLKQQNKDNPQKLNKEIMELYKKYKINPLSGCLPMLLQMPIFIALYQALMKSVELRGAKFLWIKDLSMPDAVPLPLAFPIIGNSINILPLVMVAAMVVQQKMSTSTMGAAVTDEQKQQQKMMLIIMPVVFGFVFYNMPSGLVLYWVVNTVLTLVEQTAVLKKA